MKYSGSDKIFVILRIALGAVFVYAGIIKIAAPEAFAGSIAAYKLLPYFGNYLAAAILPCMELICGLLLLTGFRTKAAVTIIIGLNVVFTVALISTIIRGLDIDCGCFRQGGAKTSAWTALGRDAIFIIAAAAVLWKQGLRERTG